MLAIRWSRRALADLARIADFIALDKPAAAQSFMREMRSKTETLRRFPHLGRHGELPDTHEFEGLLTLISHLRCCEKAMDARRGAPARAIPCQAAQRSRRAFSQQPGGTGRFGRIPLSQAACSARTAARPASRPASRIGLVAGVKLALTGPNHRHYLLTYRVRADAVEIVQVWHVAQQRDR